MLDQWRDAPPEVILFEHRDRTPATGSEIGKILDELGFEFYRLPRSWFRVSLKREAGEFDWREVSTDVVAVQPGSAAATSLGV